MIRPVSQPTTTRPDLNNNEIISSSTNSKKRKTTTLLVPNSDRPYTIGQIKEVRMLNFMCHKNFAIQFHPTPMQIVTGANGSGKSTIANAICLVLGAQARTTGRTTNAQSFIRKGETSSELTITLSNEGAEAYKPELYGKEIQIIRKIGMNRSDYKIFGERRKLISTRKETIAEMIQALSISPENPLCVLHQEVAKTFLLNSDPHKKYQFYMKVSQIDQMKQAYEDALCTAQAIGQRIQVMKDKHQDLVRAMEPLQREVTKMTICRDRDKQKVDLEAELILARTAEAQRELTSIRTELDQTQRSRDAGEKRMMETLDQLREVDQRIESLTTEKSDLIKDVQDKNGLRELNLQFAKQKKEIELSIYRLSKECEKYHQQLLDIKEEQASLKKKTDLFLNQSQQSNDNEQERVTLEDELKDRQRQQLELDQRMVTVASELAITNETIRHQQSTIDCMKTELRQKQQDVNGLKKLEQGQTNVYGPWMADCLKAIEKETRFHRKPIGPIGRHIRCIEAHWSYAVEKHLAPIMSSFICTDVHDEKLLLDVFSHYVQGSRPTIYVMRHASRVHDISGTLDRVRRAQLLSIYEVLRIDNVTVACALIDFKQIEATILLEDLAQAKQIRQSGVLRWEKIDKKVKQVVEAWTYDGSNIKLDKAFRIYTNDRQPARYFLSNNSQALSPEELQTDIQRLSEQIDQMMRAFNEEKGKQQKNQTNLNQMTRKTEDSKKRIKQLNQELERLMSALPTASDYTAEELEEKVQELNQKYQNADGKFKEMSEKKDEEHRNLAEIQQNHENITQKMELKKNELDFITDKIAQEQSKRHEVQQQVPKLTKKSSQLHDDIQRYQDRLDELLRTHPKKLKTPKTTTRSVREIEQELNGIVQFLRSNEDTQEHRRQTIEEFKIKRDAAQASKKIADRCERQLQHFNTFVGKRKERLQIIADQHQYLLASKFKHLMEKHHFDDCEIKIDHKKEELDIIIRKNQRSAASLSGGERSVSTFCFLLALWESIYQPFRLLDEIDIYMDNEKRNASLELLYKNTQYHSSSQHVIFTPQAIDFQRWKELQVPIFSMPTPKRSLT